MNETVSDFMEISNTQEVTNQKGEEKKAEEEEEEENKKEEEDDDGEDEYGRSKKIVNPAVKDFVSDVGFSAKSILFYWLDETLLDWLKIRVSSSSW